MSEKNLFDCGASSQKPIVTPYVNKIKSHFLRLDADFIDYFMGQLDSCLAMIGEKEQRPHWVKDVVQYRLRSEISISMTLWLAVDLPETPTQEEKELITTFYERLKSYGERRGWDLQILHVQFVRSMGTTIHNYLIQTVMPRTLEPLDYN